MPVTVIGDEDEMVAELQKAQDNGKIVIIDFTATWCGPCKKMAPLFDSLSKKYTSAAVFLKVDVDQCAEISSQFEVSSMPTFLFLRRNEEIDRIIGADPEQLEKRVHTWSSSVTSLANTPSGLQQQHQHQQSPLKMPENPIPIPTGPLQQPQQLVSAPVPGNQAFTNFQIQNGQMSNNNYQYNWESQQPYYNYDEQQLQLQYNTYFNAQSNVHPSYLGSAPVPVPVQIQAPPIPVATNNGGNNGATQNHIQNQNQHPNQTQTQQAQAQTMTPGNGTGQHPHLQNGGQGQGHPISHIIPHGPFNHPPPPLPPQNQQRQPVFQQQQLQTHAHAQQQQLQAHAQQQQQHNGALHHPGLTIQQQQQPQQQHPQMNNSGGANFTAHASTSPLAFTQQHHQIAAAFNQLLAANNANSGNQQNLNQGQNQKQGVQFSSNSNSSRAPDSNSTNHNYIKMAPAPAPSAGQSKDGQKSVRRARSRSINRSSINPNGNTNANTNVPANAKNMSPVEALLKLNKRYEMLAQKAVHVKKKLPTSTVTIHLADGSKTTAVFNISQPVTKIREFIKNARPAMTHPFVIMTAFPNKEITNENLSLKEASLINSILVQKLK